MFRRLTLAQLLIALFSWAATASTTSASLHHWHADFTAATGYARATTYDQAGARHATEWTQSVLSTTLALQNRKLFAGITLDSHVASPSLVKKTDPAPVHGTRFGNVSPTLGVDLGMFITKLDVQFLGDYELSGLAGNAQNVIRYTDPLGARLNVIYPFGTGRNVGIGLVAEYVVFQPEAGSSATVLPMWQIAFALTAMR